MTSVPNQPMRPFPAAPDARRYFPAGAAEESRQRLARRIVRGEGPMLIVGAAGTGKSLLLEVLALQFRQQLSVVSLVGAQLCTRRALLQMILFELDLPYRSMDEGELRLSLMEYLRPHSGPAQQILLLVDEADSLPTRLLHELRVLTNIADQGQPLVSLVLAGGANLEERFADPQLEVFSQRLSARCYLAPFGREETFQYIRSQVAASGSDADQLFSQDGLEAIFAATDGVPRLINQLGDQLVWMAAETGYQPLDGAVVQQAWSELQQLPAPWNNSDIESAVSPQSAETVVEFGDLDDMPASIPFDAQHAQSCSNGSRSTVEAVDITEMLLEELNDLNGHDLSRAGFGKSAQAKPPKARNPFDEPFDSEEIVFDQYASFEDGPLSRAQRVVNHFDLQLAGELQQCEASSVSNAVAQTAEHRPASPPPQGKMLAVEADKTDSVRLVQGRQFRQLFSHLESGNGLPKIG